MDLKSLTINDDLYQTFLTSADVCFIKKQTESYFSCQKVIVMRDSKSYFCLAPTHESQADYIGIKAIITRVQDLPHEVEITLKKA